MLSKTCGKLRRAVPVFLIGIGIALIVLTAPLGLNAQSLPEFTADQAAAGEAAYATQCAVCHGENLSDGEFGPPLSGSNFPRQLVGSDTRRAVQLRGR